MALSASAPPSTIPATDTAAAKKSYRKLYWLLVISVGIGGFYVDATYMPGSSVMILTQPFTLGTAAPQFSFWSHGIIQLDVPIPFGSSILGWIQPKLTYTGDYKFGGVVGNISSAVVWAFVRLALRETLVLAIGFGAFVYAVTLLHLKDRKVAAQKGGWASLVVIVTMSLMFLSSGLTMRNDFKDIHRITQLLGSPVVATMPVAPTVKDYSVDAVTMGDSILAGRGLPGITPSTHSDALCGRSLQAPASTIQRMMRGSVPSYTVRNIACSSATIENGLTGNQFTGSGELEQTAQLTLLQGLPNVKVIYLSIGADDEGWSIMIRQAYMFDNSRPITQAQAKNGIRDFAVNYASLQRLIGAWIAQQNHPIQVVVNLVYDPFGSNLTCPDLTASTPGMVRQLNSGNVAALSDARDALNQEILAGAAASGWIVARPDFSGHELCSADPYVQPVPVGNRPGVINEGAFHPNELGAMLIGLTDVEALNDAAAAKAVVTPLEEAAAPPKQIDPSTGSSGPPVPSTTPGH